MSNLPAVSLLPLLFTVALATAQEQKPELKQLTLEEVLTRGPALRPQVPPIDWLPSGHRLSLRTLAPGAEGRAPAEIVLIGVPDGSQKFQKAFDAHQIRAALGLPPPESNTRPVRLPTVGWHTDDTVRITYESSIYHWRIGTERAELVLRLPEERVDRQYGSDRAVATGDLRAVYVSGHDLNVVERGGAIRRITWDGSPDIVYGHAAHRAEFGIQGGLWWSSDGRYLSFSREDLRPIAVYPYADVTTVPPVPIHGRYPMAGAPHSKVTIGIFDSEDGSLRYLEHDPDQDQYWTNVTFSPDGGKVYVALVSRGQDHMDLVQFDTATGRRGPTLLSESDGQWVEPDHGPQFLPGDSGRFLWLSPRDGFHHLYLYGADGRLQNQVTRGTFDVQELVGFGQGGVYFMAAGSDPRQRHLFHASLDGESRQRQVTTKRGTHTCAQSADKKFASDRYSNLEVPGVVAFLDLETGQQHQLSPMPDPLAGYLAPRHEFFELDAEDGSSLYGHLMLPPKLEEGRRYPVLLYVYGGPAAQLVTDQWLGGAAPWLAALAAEGYVVCRLDNRGTPNRGIEFEQTIHRRLGTLEVSDQLRAIEHVKSLGYVDPDRIGVHGWSYGGYMTLRLMLLAPKTFACGVAGAPVTDWAQYETGYTERYMDTPAENPAGYEKAGCLPLADKLEGQLLIVHGTRDMTVMWSHTLAFVDRCIDAGTFPAYLPYPMQRHGLRGRDRAHFLRLLRRYLNRHLKPGS